VRMVLDSSFTLQFLLILFAGRLLLTVVGYGTGVPGGIFAPLLALGVIVGMLFGQGLAIAIDFQKGIVLFRRQAGHGLEPVAVMGGTV